MKKIITLLAAMAIASAKADNADCLGNDLATSMGAGTTAWFGPIGLIMFTEHPHIRYVPTSPKNTYVVHYGVLLDDPSTPGVNEAGTIQHLSAPVWKVGTSDTVYREEKWWRCGLQGDMSGYNLAKYSKVVLAVYVYNLGDNKTIIAKAECVLSRGN